MKKLLFILLICFSVFFIGCTAPKGCSKEQTPAPTPQGQRSDVSTSHRKNWTGLFTGDWSNNIELLPGHWYCIRVKGTIQTAEVPDKIIYTCDNVNTQIEIDTIEEKDDCYILTFEEDVFLNINMGNYENTITGYWGDKVKELDTKSVLNVDDDYHLIVVMSDKIWDIWDGEDVSISEDELSGTFMTRESDWVGPY